MGTLLLAIGRLPRAQDCQHAMPGSGVIYMDRQKAAFIVVRVEQRQLLMAVHGIGGVVDIERDRLGRAFATLAPQIHRGPRQPDQGAQATGDLWWKMGRARAGTAV